MRIRVLAALLLMPAVSVSAQVVTTIGSSFVVGSWYHSDVTGVGTIDPTSTFARNGNGSAQFTSTSGADKNYVSYILTTPGTLSSLSSLSYDWYRDASSTNTPGQTPAFKVLIDRDAVTPGIQQAELVFEPGYTAAGGSLTVGSWVTENLELAGTHFWMNLFGGTHLNETSGTDGLGYYAAGNADGTYSGKVVDLDPSTVVYGFAFGFGSGWGGTFSGAVDNVNFGFTGGEAHNFNFESAATSVPEPGTMGMLATGLVGMAGMSFKRRKK